ncbi:hypothetical protein [Leptolyngbya sp. PCC 6406]|uniref:hypothetical protein n=1 Tax=Leptolyngbya sp. PCC 6406 TaxID=1173264 RepID=UPI0002AC4284|nr:hypothetical protein [Leptolyngbya sp. PCC 6406]
MRLKRRLNYLEPTWGYRTVLWPVVQVKEVWEAAYKTLLWLLWANLIGQSLHGSLRVGLFFLGFCGFSVVVYGLQDYESQIFIAFLAVWGLDAGVSRWRYFQGAEAAWVYLEAGDLGKSDPGQGTLETTKVHQALSPVPGDGASNWGDRPLYYCLETYQNRLIQGKFTAAQIATITVTYNEARGGPFQTHLGWVWRVSLTLRDQTDWLLGEETDLTVALRQAHQLAAQFFWVPIRIAASEGTGPYACTHPLAQIMQRYRDHPPDTVRLRPTTLGYHLCNRWTWSSVGRFCRDLFQQSGFLLFVVLMTEVMELFGELLYGSARIYGNDAAMGVLLVQTVQTLGLSPRWHDWAEVAIAMGLLLINGWHLSQNKHLLLDRHRVAFYLNRRLVAQLPTPDIHTLLVVHAPQPLVLIVARHRAMVKDRPTGAIAITGFQTLEDCRAAWVAIHDSLQKLQQNVQM